MTNKAVVAGMLLAALACAGVAGEANARRLKIKASLASMTPVAAARIGLLNPKSPLIGPALVYRGGYTPIDDMVRPRFVGGMIDIYPSTQTGFRFSVGTKYFSRTNFWIAAEQATRGVLYDPHMTRGGRGLPRGFRRYTPAMTVGYDRELAPGLVLGLEGGALTGRAISQVGPGRGISRAQRLDDKAGLNEVATLSARFAF